MKGVTSWNFTPYITPLNPERGTAPYVCRIAPGIKKFEFDFIDNGAVGASYTMLLRKKGYTAFDRIPLDGMSGRVENLIDERDYEFCVERDDGTRSSVRTVRTGYVPGLVVNYLHPDDKEYEFSGRYLCSPSLVKLDSGKLLSSMDVFQGNNAQNLTLIFESDDNGKTWKYVTELMPCFWGKLFTVNGRLYMMSCSTEYGDLLIGASDDEGKTWTLPTALFRGSGLVGKGTGWHKNPTPVVVHNGRVYADAQYGSWIPKVFVNCVISAPADSDLLDASNWVATEPWNKLMHPESDPASPENFGVIEGNIIPAPDGQIYDMFRYARKGSLILKLDPSDPEAPMTFDELIEVPWSASKLEVHFDEVTGKYLTIGCRAIDEPKTERNLLSLFAADDFKHWYHVCDLIDCREMPAFEVGFQYISMIIDGDDILYLSRTAYNKAHNFHDANYQTFHKIESFRKLL